MALPDLNRSLIRDLTIPIEPGRKVNTYSYGTKAALATVLTAGHFNFARGYLQAGDVIDIIAGVDGDADNATALVTSVPATGDVTVAADVETEGGGARAVVPTADGLTTGLILPTDKFVEATSADANHILTLPAATAATRGREIWIWVAPATNCELRTPAGTNQTINNVDSDGDAEALLTHTQLYVCRQHLATGWLLQAITALGADAAAIVPD